MFVLGLLILAAAVVFAVEFVLANHSGITFKLWNQTWHMDAFWLGVMGAGFLLAVVIAVGLMRMSVARSARLRAQRRELAAENERLSARSKHGATSSRKDYPPAPGYAAPAGAPAGTSTPAASYPAPPPAPADAGQGRQVAYAGGAAAPAEADNGRHHRFFGRHNR